MLSFASLASAIRLAIIMGQMSGALTLGHGAGLPSNGTSGPDLPQRIAKDCWEVICVRGLMSPGGEALLLHALQRAAGR